MTFQSLKKRLESSKSQENSNLNYVFENVMRRKVLIFGEN